MLPFRLLNLSNFNPVSIGAFPSFTADTIAASERIVRSADRISSLETVSSYHDDGSITIRWNVPGIDPSKIKIRVEDRKLMVGIEDGTPANIRLSDRADINQIEASCRLGILEVRIPRLAPDPKTSRDVPIST